MPAHAQPPQVGEGGFMRESVSRAGPCAVLGAAEDRVSHGYLAERWLCPKVGFRKLQEGGVTRPSLHASRPAQQGSLKKRLEEAKLGKYTLRNGTVRVVS